MELNDNEFDATFRRKVFDTDPQFEDAAWDKMEQKLKRRDRIVFFRKSAVVTLALLAGLWGYYSFDRVDVKKIEVASSETDKKDSSRVPQGKKETEKTRVVEQDHNDSIHHDDSKIVRVAVRKGIGPGNSTPGDGALVESYQQLNGESSLKRVFLKEPLLVRIALREDILRPSMIKALVPVSQAASEEKNKIKSKKSLPVSLAISAGPEFNSASSLVGGNPGFSAGLTFGFGISKNLDLQTGVRYSIKKYNGGGGIRYNFPNTSSWPKNNLTALDASCDVLEIPLQASYTVLRNGSSSVNLNAGISSYLMLKEDYVFKYKSLYGTTQKIIEKNNANQHFLSVVDLSATYFIKLKSDNLKLGIEPFVKIPLTGVGEGNINLKSSGVSLKLRYDLDKNR
ncbi:MAG TPA: hypothetical protein VKB19_18100 [Pedobacter sp.]|nr:hypothetical protein [Pedobacter sp.]